jgi:uncharacterized protein YggL (DUF469 family)
VNKRIRKKKRIGEFRELAFMVHMELRCASAEAFDAFWDQWFREIVHPLRFVWGGGGRQPRGGEGAWLECLCARSLRGRFGTLSEADRDHVISWCDAQLLVMKSYVSPLYDLHQGVEYDLDDAGTWIRRGQ